VKSFSGYIHLPKGILSSTNVTNNYTINLFFWFFEARNNSTNAPLALWLNGGPGTSSMKGLFHGTGPCTVNSDSQTITSNPWSWNNNVNMLYIDQPVQTGFSYDVLLKTAKGVTASQNAFQTAQTTGIAARTLWIFTQAFMTEFPMYKPKAKSLSIWSTSYGGRWAPSFGAYFLRRSAKKMDNEVPLKIDTIGIVNGL
jgi:carboxypeptidase C (cathepsin A)